MKKSLLIFLFLAGVFLQVQAASPAAADNQWRDSIFSIAAAQANDTLRSKYLRGVFQQYIGKPQAVEYLDSALALSVRKGIHREELWTLFDYCRHYQYCNDMPNLERYFQKLKEASYRYKEYTFYYTIWMAVLQSRCAQGDTEYAIIQAKEMGKEATRLKYRSGQFVASLALAQAYSFAGQNDEAIAIYKQTLADNPDANRNSLLSIHGRMAEIYQKQKQYPQALKELQMQLDIMRRIVGDGPLTDTHKTSFLGIETTFCEIYIETGNTEKLKEHLERAKIYHNDNTYFHTRVDYYALWGTYYQLTQEWDQCLHHFDLALAVCAKDAPFLMNRILNMKAKALMEAGKSEEAARTYRLIALRADSLNQDIMRRHEEVYQANYKIQNALLEQEKLKHGYRWPLAGAAAVILLLSLFVLGYVARVRAQLRRSEEDTRHAYELLKAADKMKERFLHNITYEIRIPLNTVVGFSELLSSENGLTENEVLEYSTAIKKNSVKLLSLINNILDLSRLEAGMMRFNVQECEAVQMCREVKMMTEMAFPERVEPVFHTDIEELMIQADSRWFLKMLTSLLALPTDYEGQSCKVEYTLGRDDTSLTITVKGSPLYLYWEDEQEQRILHDINRLYVETFKGTYRITGEGDEKTVYITYPIA